MVNTDKKRKRRTKQIRTRKRLKAIEKKKSQFSVLNSITTEFPFPIVSRIFQTERARSLFFFFFYSIYFCCKFIIFFWLLFFHVLFRPILLVVLSFLSRSRAPFVWYDFYSSGSHLARKKFDGFKIRFGQKSAFSFKRARFYFRIFDSLFFTVCAPNYLVSLAFLSSFFIKFNAGRNNENIFLEMEKFPRGKRRIFYRRTAI